LKTFLVFALGLFFLSCTDSLVDRNKYKNNLKEIIEVEVVKLPLNEFTSNKNLEFSGLCWYKDYLVMLPQYPSKIEGGSFFYLSKNEILESIKNNSILEPKLIKANLEGLEQYEGFGSGYEAVIFNKDTLLASIEYYKGDETVSVIVKGIIDSNKMIIDFDEKTLLKLPNNSGLENFSEESLIIAEESLIAIHEANFGEKNYAFKIPFSLKSYQRIEFPKINFRITDASEVEDSLKFYAVNYLWKGDDAIFPVKDLISEKWGIGKTNKFGKDLERIVQFRIYNTKIELTEKPPIYLKLDKKGRNWEGIVRLDNLGFLIITDKHPSTILGFVPFEQ